LDLGLLFVFASSTEACYISFNSFACFSSLGMGSGVTVEV